MVVALQVAGPAPRRWFRRRKASAQMEKIRVGDGMYYLLPPGREAGPAAVGGDPPAGGPGRGADAAAGGLEVPDEAGIKPFCGELLGRR